MQLEEVFGWMGNVFFIIGGYYIANIRPATGLTFNLIANCLYVVVAIITELNSLFAISLILAFLNAIGIYKWLSLTK
jgi:hypothetical protein